MQRQIVRMMILLATVVPLALVACGCGGSSPGSSATGDLTVTVLWPEGDRTIPPNATRIHLTVSGEGLAEPEEADITQPATTHTFTNMAVGAKSLTVQAYDSANTWLAAGAWWGEIRSGQTTEARVTLSASEVQAHLQAWTESPPYTLVQLEEEFDWFDAATASSPGDPAANFGWAVSKLMVESERIAERYGILIWPVVIGPYMETPWWMQASAAFRSRDASQRVVLAPLSNNLALLPESKMTKGFPSFPIPGTGHTTLDAYNDLIGLIPTLEDAIDHLQTAEAQSGVLFTLVVTDEWGNQQSVTFYSADVKALEGVVQTLRGLLYIISSREWDWGSYQPDELATFDANDDGTLTPEEWLPADPFGNLMGDGNTRLASALSALVRTADLGVQVIDELVSNGDPNELINGSEGNPNWAADMADTRQGFVNAQGALAGQADFPMNVGFWVESSPGSGYWYSEESLVTVTLNIPAWFNSPEQDLKDLMPDLGYRETPWWTGHFDYEVIPDSWPDRTFNGLLPNHSQLANSTMWGPPTFPPPWWQ